MDNDTTYISFYNKTGEIRIFKRAIRAIGKPSFIRFLLHQEKRMLLIEPYEKISFTSFRCRKILRTITEDSMCIVKPLLV